VTSLNRFQFKLKNVRRFLKGWGFNRVGNIKKRKKKIYEALGDLEQAEEDSYLNEEQARRRCDLLIELYRMLEEELYCLEEAMKHGYCMVTTTHNFSQGGKWKKEEKFYFITRRWREPYYWR
jgi:stage III sporulation protein SpoIIIAA